MLMMLGVEGWLAKGGELMLMMLAVGGRLVGACCFRLAPQRVGGLVQHGSRPKSPLHASVHESKLKC